MENAPDIATTEPVIEPIKFDAVELAGLIVPLLLAIMTIVLVAMNPDPSGTSSTADQDSKTQMERREQIHRR